MLEDLRPYACALDSRFFSFGFIPSVPSTWPPNLKVEATSSSSIRVTWHPMNQSDVHGILLGYNVTYAREDVLPLVWETEVLPPGEHSLDLQGLRKFTPYVITVCAFTSKGCGDANVSREKTFGDSKSEI